MENTGSNVFRIYRPLADESLPRLRLLTEAVAPALQAYFDDQQLSGMRVRVVRAHELTYLSSHVARRLSPDMDADGDLEGFKNAVRGHRELQKVLPLQAGGVAIPDRGKNHMLGICFDTQSSQYRAVGRNHNHLKWLLGQYKLAHLPIRVPNVLPLFVWKETVSSRLPVLSSTQRDSARAIVAGHIAKRAFFLNFDGVTVGGDSTL